MDPVTGAVVAIVLFLVSVPVVWVFATILLGLIIGAISEDAIFLGGLIGWFVGVAWGAFALIQVVLQTIRLVGLLTGSIPV